MALPAGGLAPVINKAPHLLTPGRWQRNLPELASHKSGEFTFGLRERSQELPAACSLVWSLWEPQEPPWLPLRLPLSDCFVLPASSCFLVPRPGLLEGPCSWGSHPELWSCSCNATCISWGVSPQWPSWITPRAGRMWELHHEFGWFWESYGSILEICEAVWLAVLERHYSHLLDEDQGC